MGMKQRREELRREVCEKGRLYLEERQSKIKEINYGLAQKYFSNISIADIDESVLEKQVKTRLANRGIKTLADVLSRSEEELTSIKGIGKDGSCMYCLKSVFEKYGLDLMLPKY
jgi:DNA-directed RNA polymerase alpha subunit